MLIGKVMSFKPDEGTPDMDHDKSQRAEVRGGRIVAVRATKVGEDFMISDWFYMTISG